MQHIQSKVSTPSNSTTYAHTCINTTVIAKIRRLNYSVLYIIQLLLTTSLHKHKYYITLLDTLYAWVC